MKRAVFKIVAIFMLMQSQLVKADDDFEIVVPSEFDDKIIDKSKKSTNHDLDMDLEAFKKKLARQKLLKKQEASAKNPINEVPLPKLEATASNEVELTENDSSATEQIVDIPSISTQKESKDAEVNEDPKKMPVSADKDDNSSINNIKQNDEPLLKSAEEEVLEQKLNFKKIVEEKDLEGKAEKEEKQKNLKTTKKNILKAPQAKPDLYKKSLAKKVKDTKLSQSKLQQNYALKQFINNETSLLFLPNDEVILGELSQQAKLKQLSYNDHKNKFWQVFNKIEDMQKLTEMNRYTAEFYEFQKPSPLLSYLNDNKLIAKNLLPLNYLEIEELVIKAIVKDDFHALRVIFENYDIIHMRDDLGNNLIAQAVIAGSLKVLHYLILNGADINSVNINAETPLMLAKENKQAYNLLIQAGATK